MRPMDFAMVLRRGLTMAGLALLTLIGAPRDAGARHIDTRMIEASGAEIEATPCWFEAPGERRVDCARLAVPFDWNDPASAMQRLPVVVFRAIAEEPSGDPIVFLTGGPGQRVGIRDAGDIAGWAAWLEREYWTRGHDFIVVTQRGTNWTDSNLHCAELGDPRVYAGVSDEAGAMTDWRVNLRRAVLACRDAMIAAGIPIAAFNTKQNATDVAALRHLMDIERWTLYGVSYGTRLALTVMRHDPDGVGAAILDSVWPPALVDHDGGAAGFDRALTGIFEACRAQLACDFKYPGLDESLAAIIARLRRQPLEHAVASHDGGRTLHAEIDAGMFMDILVWGMYWWQNIERVPRLIHQFAQGDDTGFSGFATDYYFDEPYESQAHGMATAVSCNDDHGFVDPAMLARQKDRYPLLREWISLTEAFTVMCEGWPLNPPDPWEKTPVASDAPSLILAGGLDPVTPPENATFAAATLPRAHLFVFPATAHDVIDSHECASALVAAFLANPGTRPEVDCYDPDETPDFE